MPKCWQQLRDSAVPVLWLHWKQQLLHHLLRCCCRARQLNCCKQMRLCEHHCSLRTPLAQCARCCCQQQLELQPLGCQLQPAVGSCGFVNGLLQSQLLLPVQQLQRHHHQLDRLCLYWALLSQGCCTDAAGTCCHATKVTPPRKQAAWMLPKLALLLQEVAGQYGRLQALLPSSPCCCRSAALLLMPRTMTK